jgi:hypothetical protein
MVADEPLTGAKIVVDSYVCSSLGKPVYNVAPDAGAASYEYPMYGRRIHNFTEARSKVHQPPGFKRYSSENE